MKRRVKNSLALHNAGRVSLSLTKCYREGSRGEKSPKSALFYGWMIPTLKTSKLDVLLPVLSF